MDRPSATNLEKMLWATADKLRANMDAAEYKHIVLGLIFLKYISDSFAGRRAELEKRLTDKNDDYYLADADSDTLNAELEDRDYYREVNVFWVPESARWEALRAAAKQPDIGKRIDDALSLSSKPKTPSSRASWTSAMPAPSCPMASSANWLIWFPPSALATMPTRPAICSARSTNTSSASLPAPKARRAGSSIRPPAS
jgi:hypothetical protein